MTGSCTHRLTDFTVISTKNVPIGKGVRPEFVKGDTRVKGKDLVHTILFFPLGAPNLKEAIDKAIESTPGAIGLADGVVKSKSWYAIVYGQNAYIVEGTPIFEATEESEEEYIRQPKSKRRAKAVKSNKVYVPREDYEEDDDEIPAEPEKQKEDALVFLHEVKAGETINGIAKQYNVSTADIIKWNKLRSSKLTRGTTLRILIAE